MNYGRKYQLSRKGTLDSKMI